MARSTAELRDTRPAAPSALARLLSFPADRRAKWFVLLIWVIAIGAITPLASQLSSLEQNDATSWLPQNAESLQVEQLERQFAGSDTVPAVVIYHRDGGLTPADFGKAEADLGRLTQQFPDAEASPLIPSESGEAFLYTLPLRFSDLEQLPAIRESIAGTDGLDVKVTGPAGFSTDLANVFSGINSTLLFASAGVVTVLLLLIYRSPFLWLVPLLAVGFAHQASSGGAYGLVKVFGVVLSGQSLGILAVLVFGVGTDYALLLIARYREELRRHEDAHEAMAFALRRARPAILASGGTTAIGLLCLLAADMNSTRGLGPVGAIGIVSALLAMLTLLPAILVIVGRRVFWPFVPHFESEAHGDTGIWVRIGDFVSRRARVVWISTVLLLGVMSLGLLDLDTHLTQEETFRTEPEAIAGQKLIAEHYAAGAGEPTVVIAQLAAAQAVEAAIADSPGVVQAQRSGETADLVAFNVTLDVEPGSQQAFRAIEQLRERVHAVPAAGALVGGGNATELDVANANARDSYIVIPLILLVVMSILVLLLRSIVAPLILTVTTVLSFAATVGASMIIFDWVFGFAGLDPTALLLGFVFLVTLGVDYNIFLMSRIHEEAEQHTTRAATLKGLAVTGGVITSAGLVLAGTFSVLGVLPLVALTQLGFMVAFGVLLETFLVRSILVPALTIELDRRVWWPSRLSRAQ